MAANFFNLQLPCLLRPKSNEESGATKQCNMRPHQESYRRQSVVEAEKPRVSLDKVRIRSSNAVAAATRYHHRDVSVDYKSWPGKVLGEGCSGKVYMATSIASGRRCALKRIKKDRVSPRFLQQLIAEVEICLTLDHPNVVRLDDVYDTDSEIALLTECLEGGELYSRLIDARIFSEPVAVETTRQLLHAVGYLHSHNIVHRDLKLENIMYESTAADSPLKVIDFGFAKVWNSSTLMQASCGSVAYVSPDVLCGRGYTSQCDLWSLGVIVFMLLVGYPPFHGSDCDMKEAILEAEVDWNHTKRWAKVSQDAIDFVKALLIRDPAVRLDAHAALNHRWLMSETPVHKPVLSAQAIRSIESYAGGPSLRRAVLQLVARELDPNDVADLRRIFLDMAGDEEGTVRLCQLKAAIRGDVSVQTGDSDADPKTPAGKLRRAKTETFAELFHAMDANGDDQVYYSEFLAATMNEDLKISDEHLRAAFRRLDADNSGAISAEDIRLTLGETFEGVETRLLMRDAGFSPSTHGEISFDSFAHVLEDRNGRVQIAKGTCCDN